MAVTSSVISIAAISAPLVFGVPAPVSNSHTTVKVRAGHSPNVVVSGTTVRPSVVYSVGQSYYWTDEWQKQEDLAAKELREGRYHDFDTAEDAITWLFDDEA